MAADPSYEELEQQYPQLVQTARLSKELYENPKTRRKFLGLIKEFNPNVRIPELDVADEFARHTAPLHGQIQGLREQLVDRDAMQYARDARDRLLQSGHIEDEAEIDQVVDLARAERIGNIDTAAELYANRRRAAIPRSAPSAMQLPDYKGLFKNPTQWARKTAYDVLGEVTGKARRSGRFM